MATAIAVARIRAGLNGGRSAALPEMALRGRACASAPLAGACGVRATAQTPVTWDLPSHGGPDFGARLAAQAHRLPRDGLEPRKGAIFAVERGRPRSASQTLPTRRLCGGTGRR